MSAEGHYIDSDSIENWPSGTSEEEKQQIIDFAEQVLEAALGTHYYEKDFYAELNGNGKNRLFIPVKANILTIEKVMICDEELDDCVYTWDANSIYVCCESNCCAFEPGFGYLERFLTEGVFPKGFNNIRIWGTYGSSVVPAWIKEAAKMIAEHKIDPTLYTSTFKSETMGRYSYDIGDVIKNYKTGIKEVDDLIALFGRKRAIIMAP
jgi:hypothetical protein